MENLNIENLKPSEVLDKVLAMRAALAPVRYERVKTIVQSVKPEGYDDFGRANVIVDGKAYVAGIARGTAKGLASYDLVLEAAKADFKYNDRSGNSVVVLSGTPRFQLVASV